MPTIERPLSRVDREAVIAMEMGGTLWKHPGRVLGKKPFCHHHSNYGWRGVQPMGMLFNLRVFSFQK